MLIFLLPVFACVYAELFTSYFDSFNLLVGCSWTSCETDSCCIAPQLIGGATVISVDRSHLSACHKQSSSLFSPGFGSWIVLHCSNAASYLHLLGFVDTRPIREEERFYPDLHLNFQPCACQLEFLPYKATMLSNQCSALWVF